MRRVLLLVVAVFGCRERALSDVTTAFTVPEFVDCGHAFVGQTKPCSVDIVNESRAVAHGALSFTDAFTGPAEFDFGSGTSSLAIDFKPASVGVIEGTVELSVEGQAKRVRLKGTGVAPQICAPAACHVVSFDLEAGSCISSAEADGTSCSEVDRCVVDGRCARGVCVGTQRACDDGDPCTVDSCDSAIGCLHQARACPAASNPCEAAMCDRQTGCGVVAVTDGTPCGANDCVTANVCISGRCEQRAAPVGSVCGRSSPCRSEGRCLVNGTCGDGQPAPPRVAWQYRAPAGQSILSSFTTNAGRTYVTTGDPTLYAVRHLVALNTHGQTDFSIDVAAEDPTIADILNLFEDGSRFCLHSRHGVRRESQFSCRDQATGAKLWNRTVESLAIPVNDPVNGRGAFYVRSISSIGQGDLLVFVTEGSQTHTMNALALDGVTGATRWRFQRPGHGGLQVGRSGEMWMSSSPCWGSTYWLSRVSSTGRSIGSDTAGPYSLRAMADDVPLVSMQAALYAVENAGRRPVVFPPGLQLGPSPVLYENGELTTITVNGVGTALTRIALDGGAVVFSIPPPRDGYLLQLINDGGTALTSARNDGGTGLYLYSSDAQLIEQCEIPAAVYDIATGWALGRTPSALTAFELPGFGAAPSGWPRFNGFNQSGRAR